jgi:hypothetical protein
MRDGAPERSKFDQHNGDDEPDHPFEEVATYREGLRALVDAGEGLGVSPGLRPRLDRAL